MKLVEQTREKPTSDLQAELLDPKNWNIPHVACRHPPEYNYMMPILQHTFSGS